MTAYETGKFYRVPCLYARYFDIVGWWPVIGPLHDDHGAVNFPWLHHHIDVRFISERMFRRLAHRGNWRPSVTSQQFFARSSPIQIAVNGKNFMSRDDVPPLELRRRRCARQWEHAPELDSKALWIPKLEAEFKERRLKNMVCPHRGADLSTLPIDRHGCVECPLHGLRWHVATGKLVPRAEWSKAEVARA